MKALTEKFLRSGLMDKHTAELMERFGLLPEGASEQVREDTLKDATQAQLVKMADELLEEVERSNILRETILDLERIRWPISVVIMSRIGFVSGADGVVDRQGRLYFRIQDARPEWFVPGYTMQKVNHGEGLVPRKDWVILESQILHIDDKPVCIQVTVRED